MTLNEAITQGKIRLETPRATVSDYLTDLELFRRLEPTSHSMESIQTRRAWLEEMSQSQRDFVLSATQNPHHLLIRNLSGSLLIFESDGAMVGTRDQAAAHVPEAVRQSTSADKALSQDRLWISQIQSSLNAVGYSVSVDGLIGKGTRMALLDFQHKHGLKTTGELTSVTAEKLRELSAKSGHSITSGTEVNSDFFFLRVENNPEATNQFQLMTPSGAEVYAGNKQNELIDAIAAVPVPAGKQKYLELHNFSQTQQRNLASSFRTYADIIALPHDTMSLPNDIKLGDVVTRRGLKLAFEPRIEEIEAPGLRQGWFRTLLDFAVEMGRSAVSLTVEVFARSRQELLVFLEGARPASNAISSEQDAIALFVARGRRNVIAAYGTAHTVDILITKTQTRRLAEEFRAQHSTVAAGF